MKMQFFLGALKFCLSFVLLTAVVQGQITPKDTVIPNQFEFISARYFASSGATNAVITVRFFPGGRSWSGSVNYATRNGTATANQDYAPVNGTLNFSGTAYQSFTVPLTESRGDQPKTILLVLTPNPSDSNALITLSNAVLNINLPPPPNLVISPAANGTVVISWSDDGTAPLLEKRDASTTASWSVLGTMPVDGNGKCSYTDVSSTGMALYRLRRPQ
jgi:hypothetical protein